MKLINDFYTITKEEHSENSLMYDLNLNKEHFIYKVHFPENPITPGACIIQICKELIEKYFEEQFLINKIVNVKFLEIINPLKNEEISVSISKISHNDTCYKANFLVHNETTQFSKLSLQLQKKSSELQQHSESGLCKERMEQLGVCVIIPTYNNDRFLESVISSVIQHASAVIVVNDGSTDNTENILNQWKHLVKIVSYRQNRGKGYAINQGFEKAREMNFKYAVTLDSDGQHKAEDFHLFIEAITHNPEAMIIGNRGFTHENMPKKNSFANKFSNFWFAVQTGISLPDTQTGFRLYPLCRMKSMKAVSSRYEAELELLVRMAWRNIQIISIPIHVEYLSDEQRISHFRPGKDFFRISVLNTIFVFFAVFYGYPSMLIRSICSGNRKKH